MVRKDGPGALLRIGAVVLEFEAAGLLPDRVVVLNGDIVVWVGAQAQNHPVAHIQKCQYNRE